MQIQPIILTGNVVRLEPLSYDHIPDLTVAGQDLSIWRWMLYGELMTQETMHGFVQEMLNRQVRGADLPFAVIHLATNKAIGCTRFSYIQPSHRKLEIGGTWYGVEYQRTAVNTECKYLMLTQAFEIWQAIRVQFTADLNNVPSQRALERIGAVKEGILRNHFIRSNGNLRDSVIYSIINREWPQVKANLKAKLK